MELEKMQLLLDMSPEAENNREVLFHSRNPLTVATVSEWPNLIGRQESLDNREYNSPCGSKESAGNGLKISCK